MHVSDNALGTPQDTRGGLGHDLLWLTRRPVRAIGQLISRNGRPERIPPGPTGLPVVGVIPQLWQDPFGYLDSCAKQYGDIYRVPMPFYDVVMLNHPDHVTKVFDTRDGHWSMVGRLEPLATKVLGGRFSALLEGQAHRNRRRLLNPKFGHRHMARLSETIVDEFALQLDKWDRWVESGEEFDLQNAIAGVTLPAFLRSMYSTTFSDDDLAAIHHDFCVGTKLAASALMLRPPSNPVKVGLHLRSVHRMIKALVAEREASSTTYDDMLGFLIEAHREDPDALPSSDLTGELIGLMAGGYETVVAALSWTFAFLSANPEPLQLLYEEIDALEGARPTHGDLPRLNWAKACFDEAQRLQGHPFMPHFAMVDEEIDGYPIPAGTQVAVSFYSLHRDPRWWPDPDRYDPTRFTDEAVIAARPRTAFIPFGFGEHRCIGSGMAYMNGQFLLAMIFQRYRIHVRPGWQPRHETTFTTTIKGGLPVTITRRNP